MISAQNHRRPLNGNKALLWCLLICTICSCAGPRHAAEKPPVTPPLPDITHDDDVEQYDPKTDSVVLVPRDAIHTDTIRWSEDKTPPIVTDAPVKPVKPTHTGVPEIAVLIPFHAAEAPLFSEHQDSRLNRFIQYYAGMQMAMDEMDSSGLQVKVHSYDIGNTTTSVKQLLSNAELRQVDVIVGPYDKSDLEAVAAYGLKNETMVVSPWLPAITNESANPFLIQLYPGLATHAQAIMEYISEEMPGKKVYVVARDNPAERNRIQVFSKDNDHHAEELIIKDSSPDLVNTNLFDLMSDATGTVFILPYFSKTDETFVNSFMRKLHADKDTREAIVFGLPQWVGYTNLNPNYMESLSLHLSISSFIDVASPEYPAFRTKFFKTYHTVPDLNAFLGYDLMTWLAMTLSKEGQEGLIGDMDPQQYGLASGFDIKPYYKSNTLTTTEMKVPMYYENRRIRILRYVEQDFILVR